jgi:hypothetical protein
MAIPQAALSLKSCHAQPSCLHSIDPPPYARLPSPPKPAALRMPPQLAAFLPPSPPSVPIPGANFLPQPPGSRPRSSSFQDLALGLQIWSKLVQGALPYTYYCHPADLLGSRGSSIPPPPTTVPSAENLSVNSPAPCRPFPPFLPQNAIRGPVSLSPLKPRLASSSLTKSRSSQPYTLSLLASAFPAGGAQTPERPLRAFRYGQVLPKGPLLPPSPLLPTRTTPNFLSSDQTGDLEARLLLKPQRPGHTRRYATSASCQGSQVAAGWPLIAHVIPTSPFAASLVANSRDRAFGFTGA